MLSVKI